MPKHIRLALIVENERRIARPTPERIELHDAAAAQTDTKLQALALEALEAACPPDPERTSLAPAKLLWRDREHKGRIARIANPEALLFGAKDDKPTKHKSGLEFRVRFDPEEVETRANCAARRTRDGALSLTRLEEILTASEYEEELWSWEKIKHMCMPGKEHKFPGGDVPLIVRLFNAPLIFRRHEDDPVKGRGTFAWYPLGALGYDGAKHEAHIAHARRRADATSTDWRF